LKTGNTLLEFSGIRTTAQRIVELHNGFAITHGACNAAVLYATEDWRTAIEHANVSFILQRGFDTWMSEEYGSGRPCATLVPSAVYHLGHFGVHGKGDDMNIDYTEEA
jgi:hypothetical protein